MTGVQFEEEQFPSTPVHQASQPKGLIGLLIRIGIARNPLQANLFLIGLLVILLVISYFTLQSLVVEESFDTDPAPYPMDRQLGIYP